MLDFQLEGQRQNKMDASGEIPGGIHVRRLVIQSNQLSRKLGTYQSRGFFLTLLIYPLT